jgi:hypothetical protein
VAGRKVAQAAVAAQHDGILSHHARHHTTLTRHSRTTRKTRRVTLKLLDIGKALPIPPAMDELAHEGWRAKILERAPFHGAGPVPRLYLAEHDILGADADDVPLAE